MHILELLYLEIVVHCFDPKSKRMNTASSNHASLCQSLTRRDKYTISLGYFLFPFAAISGHQV